MDLYYNTGGAWHYNVYNPASAEASYHYHQPTTESSIPVHGPQPQAVPCEEVKYIASLKVISPTKKKDFTMFTLRNLTEKDINTPISIKETLFEQVGESVVSRKLDFPVGYYHKSAKLWLNNEQDVQDALAILKKSGRLTFWCVGLGEKSDSGDRDSDVEGGEQRPTKRRKLTSEEKGSHVQELKTQLRQNHGSKYSGVQYALWAEMIVGGTHDSMDEAPPVPMFGANRPHGRPSTGNLADALTDVADRIANAFSPTASRAHNPSGNFSSPNKSVELRGKYIQQLKEMVNLRDIGALTDEEYEEQRSVVVNLMRKLSSN